MHCQDSDEFFPDRAHLASSIVSLKSLLSSSFDVHETVVCLLSMYMYHQFYYQFGPMHLFQPRNLLTDLEGQFRLKKKIIIEIL